MAEQDNGASVSSVFLAFVAGAAAGAGLALLLAPKAGDEVRQQIKELAEDALDKTKEYARTMQDKAREVLEKGKEAMSSCCKEPEGAVEEEKPAA
jgi:gas vesicle protein